MKSAKSKSTFPADWRVPNLAGQTAKVTLKADQVAESFMPEIDEAFIKSFGVSSGKLEVFRKEVRANLERELKGTLMNRLRAEVGAEAGRRLRACRVAAAPGRDRGPHPGQRARPSSARQQGQTNVTESPEPFMNAARKRVPPACWSAKSPARTTCRWTRRGSTKPCS